MHLLLTHYKLFIKIKKIYIILGFNVFGRFRNVLMKLGQGNYYTK